MENEIELVGRFAENSNLTIEEKNEWGFIVFAEPHPRKLDGKEIKEIKILTKLN